MGPHYKKELNIFSGFSTLWHKSKCSIWTFFGTEGCVISGGSSMNLPIINFGQYNGELIFEVPALNRFTGAVCFFRGPPSWWRGEIRWLQHPLQRWPKCSFSGLVWEHSCFEFEMRTVIERISSLLSKKNTLGRHPPWWRRRPGPPSGAGAGPLSTPSGRVGGSVDGSWDAGAGRWTFGPPRSIPRNTTKWATPPLPCGTANRPFDLQSSSWGGAF